MPDLVPLLDPHARAGRTGFRLNVRTAKTWRMFARNVLGNSREDTPGADQIIAAAQALGILLYDATEGDAQISVQFNPKATCGEVEHHHPRRVLDTFAQGAPSR